MSKDRSAQQAVAERKMRLLREGEHYRVGIARAKAQMTQALRPDSLVHGAIEHAGGLLRARLNALLQPAGLSLPAVLPLVVSALAYVRRRNLLKPALAVAAVAAVASAYFMRRRAAGLERVGH